MKSKPIQTPPDIAEKCDGSDQFGKFDAEFKRFANFAKTLPKGKKAEPKPKKR